MHNDFEIYFETAELLKVIAHPVRLCIIRGLLDKGQCNVTYMQTCLKLPQSTISQHVQKLRAAKVIVGKRNGVEIGYRINNDTVKQLINILFPEEEQKND
ncbi:metalloregulator ArsR/SmtB family transcription factor [Pelotomaculum isophthalicicum JI]|uniref:Metalloregulator ArsR/SmtB family transcription factor n=1 Tax=Pelotomaculum isophthalicicum JI TaxID=947010 RepID=A0A9X4H0H0_9FIRM|nr:metalloregulator ArsR/SmtB family transcription factor [Pelotomaculum isophthalicicum]MDF9409830.1 metalloregulator ArsR/SmtB family transcription factor [Pelotomaculum isophthalicicum JI]